MGVSLMNMLGLSSSVRIALIACYWKFLLLPIPKSSVSTGFAKQIMPIWRILCYNGSLVTWTVVSLTTAKFKPLVFSMSGFTLSYIANMFILMILYDFCLLPAQFCYTRKVESCVQIADRCAPCGAHESSPMRVPQRKSGLNECLWIREREILFVLVLADILRLGLPQWHGCGFRVCAVSSDIPWGLGCPGNHSLVTQCGLLAAVTKTSYSRAR
jgi:hypothetical protein